MEAKVDPRVALAQLLRKLDIVRFKYCKVTIGTTMIGGHAARYIPKNAIILPITDLSVHFLVPVSKNEDFDL